MRRAFRSTVAGVVAAVGLLVAPAQALAADGSWTSMPVSPGVGNIWASAYDPGTGLIVAVGQQYPQPATTWTFDGHMWMDMHAAPPGSQIAWYGPSGKVVALGLDPTNPSSCPVTNVCRNTWTWGGSKWVIQQTPTEAYCADSNLSYDAALGLLFAMGVCQPIAAQGSEIMTWAYDGTDWKLLATENGSLERYALIYDPGHRELLRNLSPYARPYEGLCCVATQVWRAGSWVSGGSGGVGFPDSWPAQWDGSKVRLSNANGAWAWNGSAWELTAFTADPTGYLNATTYDGSRIVLPYFDTTWFWTSAGEAQRPWTGGHDVVGAAAGSTDAYFAEGYTGLNFKEYLTVSNPGPAQVLKADYFTDSGVAISRNHQLAANSRTTILVNSDVGPDQAVSAHLSAPNPFIAERPMYFSFGTTITGGHDSMGAQSLGTTFYFAEGYTGNGFDEYLTLMNSSASQTANVQVTYYFNGGAAPKTVSHPVSPSSRQTVHVNDPSEAGPKQQVSMKVTSDIPVLAERPMYFNYAGKTGGSVVVGSSTPLTSLNLAEGHVGQSFDEYLTILNANSAAANLTITYYRAAGSPVQQPLSVLGNSRATVHVNDVLPSGTDSSVHVTSDQPIVVERPMYFTYNGWTGGHDAMAVPDSALSTTLYFAEGYVANNFAEYYTILNNEATPTTVTFTFFLPSGGPVTKTITVPGNSRWTELINNDLPAGTPNSVQITSSQPILAERPEYFAY